MSVDTPSQACLAAACGSKSAEDLHLPWPVNATVSRLSRSAHTMTTSRVPIAPVDRVKLLPTKPGRADYMAELSITSSVAECIRD